MLAVEAFCIEIRCTLLPHPHTADESCLIPYRALNGSCEDNLAVTTSCPGSDRAAPCCFAHQVCHAQATRPVQVQSHLGRSALLKTISEGSLSLMGAREPCSFEPWAEDSHGVQAARVPGPQSQTSFSQRKKEKKELRPNFFSKHTEIPDWLGW